MNNKDNKNKLTDAADAANKLANTEANKLANETEANKLANEANKLAYFNQFKFHKFLSLNQTKSFPVKEWVGETINDEVVVICYENGEVKIGAGWNEMGARKDMKSIAVTKNKRGQISFDEKLTAQKINDSLNLDWILPDGFVEEP